MILALAVFLGGVLTILSPCILPVLPFVFARSGQRFLTNGFPLLVGMASTFTAIATLAAEGGAWAVRVNQYGRVVSLVLLCFFAATLLSRRLADWMTRPFVALGNRLIPATSADTTDAPVLPSLLLGVATGLLWAPCAGPILGLVLTGAAISGPNARTTLLLFAYAAGAATSLGVAILAGGRVFAALKRFLGAGEWVRRALGVAVLFAVIAIAFGWDSSLLTRLSLNGTNQIEQSLISKVSNSATPSAGGAATVEGTAMPSLDGATAWLNSAPLSVASLRGKVVLIDFWTYSCINCLRSLPHVKAWYDTYRDHGLVVIGVHAPEFAFEKDADNVRQAVSDLGIKYPVALDNQYTIWRGFDNHYWPAHYFIDASGHIRAHHFGEGDDEGSEKIIRRLLTEAGNTDLPPVTTVLKAANGVQAAADVEHDQSPETYVGYRRAQNFVFAGWGWPHDRDQTYTLPSTFDLNQWALSGSWSVDAEKAVLSAAPGKLVFKFYARDLHLVLGPGVGGQSVHFRVQVDGQDPGSSHGVDVDAAGLGVVHEQRLYQLIRQSHSGQAAPFFPSNFWTAMSPRMRLPSDEDQVMTVKTMNAGRRKFLAAGLAVVATGTVLARRFASAQATPAATETVAIENFSPAGVSLGVVQVPKVVKSDPAWRAQLSSLAYRVARQEGTEVAFTGEYAESHGDGLYHLRVLRHCALRLEDEIRIGHGLAEFWQPISPKNIVKSSDSSFGMQRDAISCRRCDAHLGHVFNDGPRPTGLRYCMNSVSLHFVPRA